MPLVTGNLAPKSAALSTKTSPSSFQLSPTAIQNAQARGLGSGISLNPSGQLTPTTTHATTTPLVKATAQPLASNPLVSTTSSTSLAPAAPVLYDQNDPNQLRPGETSAQYLARTQGSQQQNPPTPQTPPTPQGNNFSGLVGSLVQTAQQGTPAVQDAIKAQRDLETQIAGQYGKIESQPIPLEFQQGREQALARQYAAQEQAAQGAVTAATTAQGQQLNALGAAVGAAQPQLGAYGQTYYQPLGGSTSGGVGQVQPSDPFYQTLQSYAQLAASGQISQVPDSIKNNSVLFSQLNDMATKINPNYTPTGSAATGAAAGDLTGQVATLSAARSSASNLQTQLTSFLQQNQINPSDFSAVNQFLQRLGAQTSSPQYQTFSNLTNDLASVYAQILTPPGGNPSDYRTQIAQSLINSAASGQSIIQVLQSLDAQAQAKIGGLQSTTGTLLNGGNPNPSSTTGGGSSGSSFAETW